MKNETVKHITCVRCRNSKKSNCFSSADRKCDQCIEQIKEYNRDEVIAKELNRKKTSTFSGAGSDESSKKALQVRRDREDMLEELRLKKEMEF